MAYKDKAQASKYIYQYTKENYERFSLTVPKGDKDAIKTHAAAKGESVNAYINRVINEDMQRGDSKSN